MVMMMTVRRLSGAQINATGTQATFRLRFLENVGYALDDVLGGSPYVRSSGHSQFFISFETRVDCLICGLKWV